MSATYTVKQVADLLGYSTNSIYTFLKERRLKGVRVGKGRFRIPQSEIDRLLAPQQKQFQMQTVSGTSPPSSETISKVPYAPPQISYHVEPPILDVRVEVPSLFDWFTGIASVILGLAMFLFSSSFEEFAFGQFAMVLPMLRVMFIAGGFGLLFSDVVGKRRSYWHLVFHGVVVTAFTLYSFTLYQANSFEAFSMYGTMTVLLLLYTMLHLDGISGFVYYVESLLVVLTVVGLLDPASSSISKIIAPVSLPVMLTNTLWIGVMTLIVLVIWIGHKTNLHLFRIGMFIVSMLMTILAIYYAQNLMWGRSFYVLLIAITSFFVPVWQSLLFSYKRDRVFVFGAFGSILCLFIIAIGAVRIMQTNIISYAGTELENKAMYGKILIDSTFTTALTSLTASSVNPILIDGMEKGKKDMLLSLVKNIFESNHNLRRIVALSKENELFAVYPYTTTDTTNYAMRDYVIRAVATKKPVISDVFEVEADNSKRKDVVLAVPVVNKAGEIVGMLVGSLDMDTLGNTLQKIVTTSLSEQVIVLDHNAKFVIHSDTTLIGSDAQDIDTVHQVLQSKRPIIREEYFSGERSLVAYNAAEGESGWVVGATTPVRSILLATPTASITMFSVISLSLLIVCVFLLSHRVKHVVKEDSS